MGRDGNLAAAEIRVMNEAMPKLKNAPIIEAVLNIECDMPPSIDLSALQEGTRKAFLPQYPKFHPILLQEHRIELRPQGRSSETTGNIKLQGFQLIQDGGRQLVQVRLNGFSFNRLAPYTALDDYLNEMERTWSLFVRMTSPLRTRLVQLRYINRIFLPMDGDKVHLENYLKTGPRLPDEGRLGFIGFLNQHTAFEHGTDNQVNIILATQPVQGSKLPIIFDVATAKMTVTEPANWPEILRVIQSLRDLKNRVFRNTLTEACINLFQN